MLTHNRVPRIVITLGLGVLALIAIQLLFSPFKSISQPALFRSRPPTAGSLQTRIEYEEAKYRVALHDRVALIRKWGPTAEDITP